MKEIDPVGGVHTGGASLDPPMITNTVSDVCLFSLVLTQFTYCPQDVSETHTSLHSTELQLILRYDQNGFTCPALNPDGFAFLRCSHK